MAGNSRCFFYFFSRQPSNPNPYNSKPLKTLTLTLTFGRCVVGFVVVRAYSNEYPMNHWNYSRVICYPSVAVNPLNTTLLLLYVE